jgi:flagellar motor switch/type III secretory pathway protein FliN
MNPQPFPWHLVSRTTHESIRLTKIARHILEHRIASERVLSRASELVRAPVTLHLRGVTTSSPLPRAGFIAIAIDQEERGRFVMLIESALAASAVMRAMKRQPPRVVDLERASPAALAGAFAAIFVAASRAGTFGPLHVDWSGDGSDLAGAHPPARVVDVHASITLDGDAFDAHVYAAEDHFRSSPNSLFTSADLIALGAVPIALPIIASAATTSAHEAASLAKGDVWLPETFLTRALSGNFFGDVVLASPTSERGVRARLAEDGSLVLVEGAEEMSVTSEKDVVVGNVGDAPVVVRVEVGSVTLSAREWNTLSAGDVISTKNKISDAVIVRIGGVEVARGELVDVEGQVGVRILSRS